MFSGQVEQDECGFLGAKQGGGKMIGMAHATLVWFVRIGLVTFTLVAFLPALACVSDEAVESEIDDVAPERVVSVTVKQMMDDYEANQIRADQLYEGKVISVRGVVNSIGEDIMGSPYVVLTDGSEFSFTGVQCLFADSHRDELANLSKGNIVTLRGRGDGYLMNAIVRGCRIDR